MKYGPIGKPFMSLKTWTYLKLIFLLSIVFGGISLSVEANQNVVLSELEALSRECFRTSERGVCKRALEYTEILQRRAAAKGQYACQTRLLGLGSNLLMFSFEEGERGQAFSMLKEVEPFCAQI